VGDAVTAPRTLVEAQAQCRALGVNLSAPPAPNGQLLVNGRPMPINACAELIAPFCPAGDGVRFVVGRGELPACANEAISPAKAASLLAEAHAKQASGPPWLLIGGGVAVAGLALYFALR
jgi:hypothetical protein